MAASPRASSAVGDGADGLTNEQRAQINEEYGAVLSEHFGSLKTLMSQRLLGASLDLNSKTGIRYALVEAQRKREAAAAAASGGRKRMFDVPLSGNDIGPAPVGFSGGGDGDSDADRAGSPRAGPSLPVAGALATGGATMASTTVAGPGGATAAAKRASAVGAPAAAAAAAAASAGAGGGTGTGAGGAVAAARTGSKLSLLGNTAARKLTVTERLYQEGAAKAARLRQQEVTAARGQHGGAGAGAGAGAAAVTQAAFRGGAAPHSPERVTAALVARERAAHLSRTLAAIRRANDSTGAGGKRLPPYALYLPDGVDVEERRRRKGELRADCPGARRAVVAGSLTPALVVAGFEFFYGFAS
jgi:hypothetical protein